MSGRRGLLQLEEVVNGADEAPFAVHCGKAAAAESTAVVSAPASSSAKSKKSRESVSSSTTKIRTPDNSKFSVLSESSTLNAKDENLDSEFCTFNSGFFNRGI